MIEKIESIEELGLTPREAKVYLALLKLGLSPIGPIIKESGTPSSKIYETLNKLAQRGFVSTIITKNIKHFQAADPQVILDALDEKRREIAEEVIPQLKRLQLNEGRGQEATIYEGLRGIKSIYEKMLRVLRKGDTLYVLGTPAKAHELLETFFLHFNKQRVKKGIKMKILYYPDAKKYAAKRKRMKLTQLKYLHEKLPTPAWTDIFADYVVIFNVEAITAFLLRDRNIAESYKKYFDIIWKSS